MGPHALDIEVLQEYSLRCVNLYRPLRYSSLAEASRASPLDACLVIDVPCAAIIVVYQAIGSMSCIKCKSVLSVIPFYQSILSQSYIPSYSHGLERPWSVSPASNA